VHKDIAKEVVDLMLNHGAELDKLLISIKENCSEEEFIKYRGAIGHIMGRMLTDVMNPIFKEHPDLKPKELG
jgi:hypothetical protein